MNLLPANNPLLSFEQKAADKGFSLVVGIDEAGRGPLAGPVVAAAVCLRETDFDNRIADSKKLSSRQRDRAFAEIFEKAYVGVGIMSESVIDEHNILRATFFAMTNAALQLLRRLPEEIREKANNPRDVCLMVDGNRFESDLPQAVWLITNGDNRSMSIACASIVAKVTRDRILASYDRLYPQYGFLKHKGYPTLQHKQAIKAHGLSPIHRRSFAVR